MSVQISRDPFARTALMREVVRDLYGNRGCWECGNTRISRTGKKSLFRYITESDGGRKYEHRGLFCCKSCHDSYHA